jgi:periplasmic divalent cation tolerance protein
MAGPEALVVLVSIPVDGTADDLARHLVTAGLAACVHRLPAGTSVYRWQGAIESADEALLVIKTTRAAWPALEAAIRAGHPYDVPEILALSVADGFADYLAWVSDSVAAPEDPT